MSRLHETEAQQILESAYDQKVGREGSSENPVVLSCGGIFIPQPRDQSIQYHVLNTASEESSAKVVSGAVPQNMLQLVMAKESMN
jgi:hypothetical protein